MTNVSIYYKNYRGEIGWRKINPVSISYSSTEFHPEEQWILRAFDVEKDAIRDFAMKDIIHWGEVSKSSESFLITRFEDFYFKRVKGVYTLPELVGLYDGVSKAMTDKITEIKERHRASEKYQYGLEMFKVGNDTADSMKWHYERLKSELAPEVAEQLKRFPTGVSYGVWLKEEHAVEISMLNRKLVQSESYRCGCMDGA